MLHLAGTTDFDAGTVIATSYLMGWRNVPLRAMLEDALQVPAVVDNEVSLAAIGESWAGAANPGSIGSHVISRNCQHQSRARLPASCLGWGSGRSQSISRRDRDLVEAAE
ncbi:MAG: ROK family protein [Terracidiphilus sp.]